MQFKTKILNIGNSKGVIIPDHIIKNLELELGDELAIFITEIYKK